MAKIVFYEANRIDEFQLSKQLRASGHELIFKPQPLSEANLEIDADIISVFIDSDVTADLIERLPNLRLIATRSTGFDHVDIEAAESHGVAVVTVPAYGSSTVAEHAFALLLTLTRKMVGTLAATDRGNFDSSHHIGFDLAGRTLGIIGAGQIGQHAARIGRGFGMNVIAYDKFPNQSTVSQIGFEYKSFDEVITASDVISLHAPLTSDDFHIINAGTIARMKPGVIIINTARGELIENRALINGLRDGHIAGAGLDTIEGEKFLHRKNVLDVVSSNAASPEDLSDITEVHALSNLPNVVLTPHSGFNTIEAIDRITATTAENIVEFLTGKVQNPAKANQKHGKLIVVRHGQSEWNLLGKWTGTTDVHLTPEGIEKSAQIGEHLNDVPIDYAFISEQIRTRETLEAIMNGSGQLDLRHESSRALNERDYGIYTGMDKNQIRSIIGDNAYNDLRRSWDGPVEGGESLKDVYQRVIPFYLRIILPRLRHGQNILVVAHGNSIRSLVKYIENISDSDIGQVEMIQEAALLYMIDADGRSRKKTELQL